MVIRVPVAAGGFYDASATLCRRHAAELLEAADPPAPAPAGLVGGLVPHAGWVYSGRLAAMTLKALHAEAPLEAVVLFGADHRGGVRCGEVFNEGCWSTPLGDVPVDEPLAAAILQADPDGRTLRANPDAHMGEHSLEVQVPLLQALCGEVRIVPISVPPAPLAVDIGRTVGKVLAEQFGGVRVVGSTDLTHHGGHFPAPGGRGAVGAKWTAKNDRRMIDIIEAMDAEAVIREYRERSNACGAGAVAATIAACGQLGAVAGRCLAYTNSYLITHEADPANPDDTTVGYASVVFARA